MIFNLEPVKRDKLGRNVANYRIRDFYEKIAEELLEAHAAADSDSADNELATFAEARELIDLMTACATRIYSLSLDAELLAEIQNSIIEHNRERGYLS